MSLYLTSSKIITIIRFKMQLLKIPVLSLKIQGAGRFDCVIEGFVIDGGDADGLALVGGDLNTGTEVAAHAGEEKTK